MSHELWMVRVYISEADHGRRASLVDDVFRRLHDQHRVRGLTVFRGIAGFGRSGEVHAADLLRFTANLPLVIEFFDAPKVARVAIEEIATLVPADHIIHWPAHTPGAT